MMRACALKIPSFEISMSFLFQSSDPFNYNFINTSCIYIFKSWKETRSLCTVTCTDSLVVSALNSRAFKIDISKIEPFLTPF